MSRHRNVRQLMEEDDYDDDDYYDDYDDDDHYIPVSNKAKPSGGGTAAAKPAAGKPKKKNVVASTIPHAMKKKPNLTTPAASVGTSSSPLDGGTITITSQSSSTPSISYSVSSTPSATPPPLRTITTATTQPPSATSSTMAPVIPAILLNNSTQQKPRLTVVICGHVDAGKSTLTGHLLHLVSSGPTTTTTTNKKQNKAPTTNFAWMLDEDSAERQHGITMDVGVKALETAKYDMVLNDAPGHADYVPAMIAGTASADAALLVLDATDPSTALTTGQTKEHVYLTRGLGITQMIVAVNKMDLIEWNQSIYEDIVQRMTVFLQSVGYKEKQSPTTTNRLVFVPVSGMTGDNITLSPSSTTTTTKNANASWYHGPCLLQALDGLEAPLTERFLNQPLRMVVTDVVEQGKGVGIRARVLQGWVKVGEKLIVLPWGDETVLTKLEPLSERPRTGDDRRKYAMVGDVIDAVLTQVDATRISIGHILCRPTGARPPVASQCVARIFVLDGLTIPIILGTQVLFHMQQLDVPAHVSKLLPTYHKDGRVVRNPKPRALTAMTQADVELTLSNPIVMEAFGDCPALGRFVLRRGGDSIAIGRVERVLGGVVEE